MANYAVHDTSWTVRDIMYTDIPLSELVHPDLAYLFISIPSNADVQVGDKYNRNTNTWTRPVEPEIVEEE